jgi:hypothetical protein
MRTFLEQINDGLIDLAWSLWTELGVSGNFCNHKDCLISLEELIILTALIGDHDPRLRDEALDWCSRYHHFVSVNRLKSLVKKFGEPIFESFSIFSATLNSVSQSNWPIFSKIHPLKFTPSKKSLLPPLNAPALLQLRLRSLFGVGARADIFTYLLTENKSDFTASDVTHIGYSKRIISELLDNLTLSGFLNSKMIRNQRKYELVKSNELKQMIGQVSKICPPWQSILQFLISLHYNLIKSNNEIDTIKVVMICNHLNGIKNLLSTLHLLPPTVQSHPERYLQHFSKWILDYINAIAQGNFRGEFESNNHNFEQLTFLLIQAVYLVDDSLDGLEFILSYSKDDLVKHAKVYKESYQLSLSFLQELREHLVKLLDFPFHEFMDKALSEIIYDYSKTELPSFLKLCEKYLAISHVDDRRKALNQYGILEKQLGYLQNFINHLRDQLAKIYFSKTNNHLLTLSSKLFKRHLVIKLYDN